MSTSEKNSKSFTPYKDNRLSITIPRCQIQDQFWPFSSIKGNLKFK